MSEYNAHKQLLADCDKVSKKKGIQEKFKFLVDKEVIEVDTNNTKEDTPLGDPKKPDTWQILEG